MKRLRIDKGRRVHLFSIVISLYKNAFLLLIPLVQFLLFRPEDFWGMVASGSVNVITATVVVTYIILKYKFTYLDCDGSRLIYGKGMLFRRKRVIFGGKINGTAVKSGGAAGVFGAVLYCCDADTGRFAVKEYLKRKHGAVIQNRSESDVVKKCGTVHCLAAAADATSAFSGILLAVPFLRRAAVVAGDTLNSGLYTGLSLWSQIASQLLPPIVASVTGLIVFGYIVAFTYEFLRHWGAKISLGGGELKVSRGIIWRVRIEQRLDEISGLCCEQGLVGLIFNVKKDVVLLSTARKVSSERELLNFERGAVKKFSDWDCIQPGKGSLFSFVWLPLVLTLGAVTAAFYLRSTGKEIAVSVVLTAVTPLCLLWLLFRAAAFERTFLYKSGEKIVLGFHQGLRLINLYLTLDCISSVVVSQNPFQHFFGSCNVRVYLRNRRAPILLKRLSIKNISSVKLADSIFKSRKIY